MRRGSRARENVNMKLKVETVAAFFLMSGLSSAEHLNPAAGQAFADYAADCEARLAKRHAEPATYIALLDLPPRSRAALEREMMAGAIRIEAINGGPRKLDGALLHDWRGAAFATGATAAQMLALLRDYNGFSRYYAPVVVSSRAAANQGQLATVAMRLKEREAITVVFDAEYSVEAELRGSKCGYSASRSRHIWQVDNAGTASERRRPEGADDGFLWRMNTYWTFAEFQNGLFIECESISLTRDVPFGLGGLITPIVRMLPRSSLEFTLTATKRALCAHVVREAH